MGENNSRKLHTHANIHTVRFRGNLQILTYLLHPLTAASSYGYDTLLALIGLIAAENAVTAVHLSDLIHRRIEIEIYMIFHLLVQILQNYIIDVRSQVAHRCIQQVQLVLQAELLELRSRRRVQLRPFSTVRHIDLIHIPHQVNRLLLADILEQRTTEIIRNIILAIRKCACASETAHDRTASAVDAALNFHTVNRTFSLFQRIARLKYRNQLIGSKDSAGACANNNYIVFHVVFSFPKKMLSEILLL